VKRFGIGSGPVHAPWAGRVRTGQTQTGRCGRCALPGASRPRADTASRETRRPETAADTDARSCTAQCLLHTPQVQPERSHSAHTTSQHHRHHRRQLAGPLPTSQPTTTSTVGTHSSTELRSPSESPSCPLHLAQSALRRPSGAAHRRRGRLDEAANLAHH